MFQISIPRIKRYALILAVTGTVVAALLWGVKEAAGFAVGASLAFVSIESWSRLAASLNPEASTRPSAAGSSILLVFRYVLIGAAMYATVKVLGVTPMAMLLGLFVAFAAVLVELLQQVSKK
ncbi:MAG: hypothetical protein ABIR70_01135 [Bryobacteraceae bacterium]